MKSDQDLPDEVRAAIAAIMEHRAQIKERAPPLALGFVIVETTAAITGHGIGGPAGAAAAAILGGFPPLFAYDIYSDHFKQ